MVKFWCHPHNYQTDSNIKKKWLFCPYFWLKGQTQFEPSTEFSSFYHKTLEHFSNSTIIKLSKIAYLQKRQQITYCHIPEMTKHYYWLLLLIDEYRFSSFSVLNTQTFATKVKHEKPFTFKLQL